MKSRECEEAESGGGDGVCFRRVCTFSSNVMRAAVAGDMGDAWPVRALVWGTVRPSGLTGLGCPEVRLPSVLAPRLKIFSKLPRSIPPGLRLPSCVPYGVVCMFTAGRFGAPGPIGRSGSRLAFIVADRNTRFAS